MKEIKNVIGDIEQAKPLVVGVDTVYVHANIKPYIKNGKQIDGLYCYDEQQYPKDEYIQLMDEANKKLDSDLIDTQLALCEIVEAMEVMTNG